MGPNAPLVHDLLRYLEAAGFDGAPRSRGIDEPVAFIDWDDAAPGTRLFDLANAVWSFAKVGEDGGTVAEQARLIRLVCDAYGWEDTLAIVDEIHADLSRARANHERAGHKEARKIFHRMVGWFDVHARELKRLADQPSWKLRFAPGRLFLRGADGPTTIPRTRLTCACFRTPV
jgi:hypothetical protein